MKITFFKKMLLIWLGISLPVAILCADYQDRQMFKALLAMPLGKLIEKIFLILLLSALGLGSILLIGAIGLFIQFLCEYCIEKWKNHKKTRLSKTPDISKK